MEQRIVDTPSRAVAAPPDSGLPLRVGHAGPAVRDLQNRLGGAGFATGIDEPGTFGAATEAALRRFQDARNIHADGICGPLTWAALIESGWRLGDRLLYQRSPMLRGDDVVELQARLGGLGFDAGRVDGIFGPDTAGALTDFQRNVGLTVDGICGPEVTAALERLKGRAGDTVKVGVREREALLGAPRRLEGRRVVVAESGGLAVLATAVARVLRDHGAVALVSHLPDGSGQAAEANRFEADLFIALGLCDDAGCSTGYWSTAVYESVGGRRLAELIVQEAQQLPLGEGASRGMRVPALRETRMPAVVCELGPPSTVVEHTAEVATALARAVAQWVAAPLES